MTYLQSLRKLESVMNYLKNRETTQWWSPAVWHAIYEVDRIYRDLKYGNKCALCHVRSDTPLCESCKAYYRRDGKFHGD